jgi:biopolymer transport protein ExbB
MLAGGISEALLTTAAGLLVAIPAYLVYIYFVGHIDRLIMEMDLHSQRLIDVISAEGLQESDVGRAPRRSRKAA